MNGSPSIRSYFETTSTLQYAVRAKLIQCNPQANYDNHDEVHGHHEGEEEAAGPRRGEGFHYLPRYVRSHHPDNTGLSPLTPASARGPAGAASTG